MAEISGGLYCFPCISTQASPLLARTTLYGTIRLSRSTSGSSYLRPMKRLMEKTVFSGLVTAWRFATSPTRRSPVLLIATIEGVTREPSALGITTGSPPSMTATQELVVPRSIPITFGTIASYYFDLVVVCVGTPYATLRIRILQPAVHSLPAPYSALRQWRVHTACALGQSH